MAAIVRARPRSDGTQRRLVRLALLGGGLLIGALALVFAWPRSDGEQTRFALGAVDGYGVGSVTTVEDGAFHLVRISDETFVALSWTDPGSGCTVPWRPQFYFQGTTGWFRDPCSGATYARDGERVFGPAPRGFDQYVVAIVNGDLIVDTSLFVCGHAPPGAPCVEQR
ncbi:MAG: hypothetical protein WEE64_14970 [Dehalococcoidia bacterium]